MFIWTTRSLNANEPWMKWLQKILMCKRLLWRIGHFDTNEVKIGVRYDRSENRCTIRTKWIVDSSEKMRALMRNNSQLSDTFHICYIRSIRSASLDGMKHNLPLLFLDFGKSHDYVVLFVSHICSAWKIISSLGMVTETLWMDGHFITSSWILKWNSEA